MNADHVADAAGTAAEHRIWSRKMIVWSAALAAVLLLGAWGAANWRAFHLAYCRHLMRSEDAAKQQRGVELLLRVHLRKGMTEAQVRAALSPMELRMDSSGGGRVDPLGRFDRYDGYLLRFDAEGRFDHYDHMPLGP